MSARAWITQQLVKVDLPHYCTFYKAVEIKRLLCLFFLRDVTSQDIRKVTSYLQLLDNDLTPCLIA